MKNKKVVVIVVIFASFVGLLVAIFNIRFPCGGMTEEGALWDGECAYGPQLIKNIMHGRFFPPFGI